MEILILIIGLFVFFEPNEFKNTVDNNIEKIDSKTQEIIINKSQLGFEIINKKGVWMFAPIANKKQKKEAKVPESRFITLPDGSKIEKGI